MKSGLELHMANTAYVLINTETGFEDEVLHELEKTPNITEAYVVYGVYDIVAKVEAETMDRLKEVITSNMRLLEKVRSTLTMIIVAGR
jgi:DNA-binding Lrp family transcriptional regulator